jgi:thioredoxin 1
MTEVTDSDFEDEVLKSDLPVLVDFWASWCPPCRVMAPVIEEISEEYKDKLKVVKLNTDGNPNVPSKYKVFSIPTLILFKDGKEVNRMVGAAPKSVVEEFISKVM